MLHFIPLDKIKILREKSNSGDTKAYDILQAQLNGDDYEPLLNEYFSPKQVEETPHNNLDIKLFDKPEELEEEHSHHPHHEETGGLDIKLIDDKPCVFGEKISNNILSLIGEVDKAIIELTNNENITDSTKAGIMNSLNELKKQSLDAISKLNNIRKDIDKKAK